MQNGFNSTTIRLILLGNDNFSLQSLKAILELINSSDCVQVVVSNEKNVVGKYSVALQLNRIIWDEFKSLGNQDQFHLGVVASFGHLIPKRIIEKCELYVNLLVLIFI